MIARNVMLAPSTNLFSYGQDRSRRTNTYDASCGEPVITGRVITVPYAIHTYGAGAAHPNMHFETFSFVLEPLMRVLDFGGVFSYQEDALRVIRTEVRKQLIQLISLQDEQETTGSAREWIEKGTDTWNCYGAFVFRNEAIEIQFAPYAVTAYAYGPQFALLNYELLIDYIRPEYQMALGLERNKRTDYFIKPL